MMPFNLSSQSQTVTKTGAITYKYNSNIGISGGSINIKNPLPANQIYGGILSPSAQGVGWYSALIPMRTTNLYYDLSPNMPALGYINGVNVLDILAVQKHLNGTLPLTNWYDRIAADVDGSTTITNADLTAIQQLNLGNTSTLPGPEWKWVNKYAEDVAGQDWFLINLPFGAQFTPTSLTTNPYLVFRATKSGDINGSNSALGSTYFPFFRSISLSDRSAIASTSAKRGDKVRLHVEISAKEDLYAYELPLGLEKNLYEIVKVESKASFVNSKHKEGLIIFDYAPANVPLIRTGEVCSIDIILRLRKDHSISKADIVDMKDKTIILGNKKLEQSSESTVTIEINQVDNDIVSKAYERGDQVIVDINAAYGISGEIQIFDTKGSLLSRRTIALTKGNNEHTFDKNNFVKGLNLIHLNLQNLPSGIIKYVASN